MGMTTTTNTWDTNEVIRIIENDRELRSSVVWHIGAYEMDRAAEYLQGYAWEDGYAFLIGSPDRNKVDWHAVILKFHPNRVCALCDSFLIPTDIEDGQIIWAHVALTHCDDPVPS